MKFISLLAEFVSAVFVSRIFSYSTIWG